MSNEISNNMNSHDQTIHYEQVFCQETRNQIWSEEICNKDSILFLETTFKQKIKTIVVDKIFLLMEIWFLITKFASNISASIFTSTYDKRFLST